MLCHYLKKKQTKNPQSKRREGPRDSIPTVNKSIFLSGWENRRVWEKGHVRGDELRDFILMVNIFVFKYVFNFFSFWDGSTLCFELETVFDPIAFRASWLKIKN